MPAPLASKFVLQKAATSGNGQAADLKGGSNNATIYIQGSAGITAGAVQPETASEPDYTGTWVAIGAPITVVASSELKVAVDGSLGAVRCRISTAIVGGTVSCYLFAS